MRYGLLVQKNNAQILVDTIDVRDGNVVLSEDGDAVAKIGLTKGEFILVPCEGVLLEEKGM